MNILYIIDNRVTGNTTAHMEKINKARFSENDNMKIFDLGKLTVNQCTGCFSCWLKTPGECIFKDSMEEIYTEIVKADIMIFVSPVKTGFVSGRIKTFMDRLIPLILPDFKIVNNEFHHKERYGKYPVLGIILEKTEKSRESDINIIKKFFERFSLNFHSKVEIFDVLEKEQEVLRNVTGNI